MDSDSSDEEFITLSIVACHLSQFSQQRKLRRRPKYKISPYLLNRQLKGRFEKDFQDLMDHPAAFKENFHMNHDRFEEILKSIRTKLDPKFRARPDSISAKEQLCITLEYLASGSLQRHIASVYRVSKQQIGPIIDRTCDAISESLLPQFLKGPSHEEWLDIANGFNSQWNLPNCVGAIDGKHVGIQCPRNAGSTFYNYKGFHSLVLMAVCDFNYKFIFVDIGAYGSEGDSTVFAESDFGKKLLSGRLNLPIGAHVMGQLMPYFFVADDAFPLHTNILKPFAPRKKETLTDEEREFNYRLSRARRCIENSFGIMCARWFCLKRTMFMNPDRVQKVVLACCVLHNWLMNDPLVYCPHGFADKYSEDGTIEEGAWRQSLPDDSLYNVQCNNSVVVGRPTQMAKDVRDCVKNYVNSVPGKVPWSTK